MTDKPRVGLIAGGGSFPVLFAREAQALGHEVYTVGLEGITPKEIEGCSAKVAYFRLGQVSGPIEFLKKSGVTKVLMAGKVQHVSIFGGFVPDLRAARLLLKMKDRKPAAILGAIADELAEEGLEVISSATFLERLLPAPGLLAGKKPDEGRLKSLRAGWKAAHAIADLDIGLAVVARGGAIVAVEGMEGTDECVRRAGGLFARLTAGEKSPVRDMVVVKVARPAQDMRFDLPVVGLTTLSVMAEAGADTLAVEAGRTLILEKDLFVREAERLGLTVLASADGAFG